MDTSDPPPAKLSPLDTTRWGVVTAKVTDTHAERLPAVLDFCRANHVGLLVARCPTVDLPSARAMERAGFELMDTLVYYARSLKDAALVTDTGTTPIRELRAGEDAAVRDVATKAFRGYLGHYHSDPKLDPAQCDAVYIDWATRSCLDKTVADGVLVAEVDSAIAAFATLRFNTLAEGEGVLFGVAPEAQGRGIYRSLMVQAMRWFERQERTKMVVSTQITNVAVQKVWSRLGFEPSSSYYTFHKWM